jgi:DNA end-binding protein Ku
MAMPACGRGLSYASARPLPTPPRRRRSRRCAVAFRSIASLSLSFGLVSIPVKVYSATESSAAVRFKLLSRGGQRVRRQYVAADEPALQDGEVEAAPAAAPAPSASRAAPTRAPGAAVAARGGHVAARPSLEPEDESDTEAEPERAPTWRRASAAAALSGAPLGDDEIVKGYEFEKGRFVTFTTAELKALAEASRPTIDIVSFIPAGSVDPIYYDKAYYLAPDKRASKTYSLLHAAMQASGRVALAKWAWRAKEYVVQIRPAGNGFVLQQLLYADEVRAIDDLDVELTAVGETELALALRLIEQIADDGYHPHQFVDEEKQRILAAVERKIAGRKVVAQPAARAPSAEVIDLVAALRASLGATAPAVKRSAASSGATAAPERKPARRAAKTAGVAAAPPKPARRRQSAR